MPMIFNMTLLEIYSCELAIFSSYHLIEHNYSKNFKQFIKPYHLKKNVFVPLLPRRNGFVEKNMFLEKEGFGSRSRSATF